MAEFGQADAGNQPHIARPDHRDAQSPLLNRAPIGYQSIPVRGVFRLMIEVSNLVYEYPTQRALDGISLAVAPQTITALVGPNGAGKTTLLRCLAALEAPYSGSVAIDGLDTREAPREIHSRLGYLPDFFGLYDELSVRRCLVYAARSRGI